MGFFFFFSSCSAIQKKHDSVAPWFRVRDPCSTIIWAPVILIASDHGLTVASQRGYGRKKRNFHMATGHTRIVIPSDRPVLNLERRTQMKGNECLSRRVSSVPTVPGNDIRNGLSTTGPAATENSP